MGFFADFLRHGMETPLMCQAGMFNLALHDRLTRQTCQCLPQRSHYTNIYSMI